ncbi:hypothetical protein [Sphingomonas melonis]|uniref:hypothetical protein n=1 Tax=Sphingomonas melonis TaxID=152682 RepID=UPI000BE37B1B|nr:hypothetical protein [Sphingomonas melonis]ATI54480.1 hypothetical protein CP552_01795 [Sphingomonas melonis]
MSRRPAPVAQKRTCDAPGCTVPVKRGMLMCLAHWNATPIHLRRAISAAWKEGSIRDWSANCLEARTYHADTAARRAVVAANLTRKHEA